MTMCPEKSPKEGMSPPKVNVAKNFAMASLYVQNE